MPEVAVTDLWAETLVTFSRVSPTVTPGGGLDRNPTGGSIYLMAYCHAEVAEATAPAAQPGGESLVMAKWWTIYLPILVNDVPLDPANYPKKGDRLRFVDDIGRSWDVDVRAVTSPETVHDHFEIETETFE
jgi:hypothetical protein